MFRIPGLRQSSLHKTSVAMVGARGGDRLLVIGADHAWLAADLAGITGLNGHLVVVDRAEGAEERVEAAAMRAGTLVAFEDAPPAMLPFDPASFDMVVVNRRLGTMNPADRVGCLSETFRVLRPGGRAVLLEDAPRAGLFGLMPQRAPLIPVAELHALLERAGWRTIRDLAVVEDVQYVEALKPRT